MAVERRRARSLVRRFQRVPDSRKRRIVVLPPFQLCGRPWFQSEAPQSTRGQSHGTLGASTYYITDEPVPAEDTWPGPEGDSPPLADPPVDDPVAAQPSEAEPASVDRRSKKTSTQKTDRKNTVPPSSADTPPVLMEGTDGVLAMPTGGLAVLLEVGRRQPALALTGRPLLHQALAVEGRIACGWTPEDLAVLLAGQPPAGMRSAGAVMSARIKLLPTAPVRVPRQQENGAVTSLPSARTVRQAQAEPLPSCSTCSGLPVPGDQCAACLGWPPCGTGCGLRIENGGPCPSCATDQLQQALQAPETADGSCPGVFNAISQRPHAAFTSTVSFRPALRI